MRAYYGSRFSPNMTATPEGFLICHNVPIARTGWYEYLGREIGADDRADDIVKVYRSPEEVFSDAAMASFEGKVATDEHPPELVTPDNAAIYTKGTVTNVRQGSGAESDLLIADLVIYDQNLIREVQDGKREVSCGYDCYYEAMEDGTYRQKQICGNHVAVVQSGRAGDRVAIKDSKPQETEGAKKMPKIVLPKKDKKTSSITSILAAVGLKQFAMDADPDEIKEAVDAMAEEMTPPAAETSKDDAPAPDPAIQEIKAQLAQLTEIVSKMVQAEKQESAPEKSIDDVIAELEKGGTSDEENEEESHTIPAEQFDEEGPVSDPEDRPRSALTGDNASMIAALKAIKPILAAIPDPVQRKAATDAAIASIKGTPAKKTYAAMQKRKKPATDGATKTETKDHSELGKEIAKKHNPHYKDRA